MLLGEQGPLATGSPQEHPTPFPFSNATARLTPWLPNSADDCFFCLGIFYSHVDPIMRLVHKPSLTRRFTQYVNQVYGPGRDGSFESAPDPTMHTFEPLTLAIFYSAINSLPPDSVFQRFDTDKVTLLTQFQTAIELGLGREDFLTTSSIEVLQAFVLGDEQSMLANKRRIPCKRAAQRTADAKPTWLTRRGSIHG